VIFFLGFKEEVVFPGSGFSVVLSGFREKLGSSLVEFSLDGLEDVVCPANVCEVFSEELMEVSGNSAVLSFLGFNEGSVFSVVLAGFREMLGISLVELSLDGLKDVVCPGKVCEVFSAELMEVSGNSAVLSFLGFKEAVVFPGLGFLVVLSGSREKLGFSLVELSSDGLEDVVCIGNVCDVFFAELMEVSGNSAVLSFSGFKEAVVFPGSGFLVVLSGSREKLGFSLVELSSDGLEDVVCPGNVCEVFSAEPVEDSDNSAVLSSLDFKEVVAFPGGL
jgi:hypothetical protein